MTSKTNPKLETIRIQEASQTFHYYKNEASAWDSFWHYHPEIEITYIHQGRGLRFVGDSIQPYQTGDLVLFGKNLPHNHLSHRSDDQRDKQVLYGLQFSNNLFRDFRECEKVSKLFQMAKYGIYFPNVSQEIKDKIVAIEKSRPLTRLIYLLEVINALVEEEDYETLSSISFDEHKDLKKQHSRIDDVTTYIMENFNKSISLEKVSTMAGLTPPSFCRWFKKNTGSTYIDYLNNIKIEKSCQFLIKTDWAIKRVAYESGFESLANFNRTFKKYKKQAPNLYRKVLSA